MRRRCRRGQHEVDRARVRHDGQFFRGRCIGCGARMIRLDGGWELGSEGRERLATHKDDPFGLFDDAKES